MLIQEQFNKFTGKTDDTIRVYYNLQQSKEAILEFSKGITKVC